MNLSSFESELLWLNIANIALGLAVAAGVVWMAVGVILELHARRRKRAACVAEMEAALAAEPGVFFTPGVGFTMADGGEPIPPAPRTRRKR